jgi:S1-C subfamily serine protease
VIVAVDDMTIVSPDQLSSAIDAHRPRDTLKLKVRRGERPESVSVKLGERPESAG